ncbi:MAG: glycine--tRNA ligase subunit beta [Candidatus Sericytochromatia bacterium]
MKDFLLEIGTEELPAHFANEAKEQFYSLTEKWLNENNLSFNELKTFSTPRRLLVLIKGLAESQPDIEKEAKGPALNIAFDTENKPTKALEGFLRSQNATLEQIEKKDFKGNLFVYVKISQKGKKAEDLLPNLIQYLISSVSVTRGMRWADYTVKFSRPIQWILAIFGNTHLSYEMEGVKASNFTCGHRFLSEGKIEINSIDDYFSKIKENNVIVDNEERKKDIINQLNEIASSMNARVLITESLLDEVSQLIEKPFAIMGNFDNKYLQIPNIVNVTVMKSHQRYFPLFDKDGKLLPNFITISNMNLNKENIRKGNETVLRARFEDAMFYYQEDVKNNLENNLEELKRVTYFEEIGSIYDKTERIEKIALFIAEKYFKYSNNENVSKATRLSKTDLVTNMVKEFTELQGEIGYYYLLNSKENEEIALGVKEQYLPTGNNDSLPSTILSQIVNFADKLDNIISCYSLGKIPTGSKDPFSLRRQSLGIIKTSDKYKIEFNLQEALSKAFDILSNQKLIKASKDDVLSKITDFFTQRIKNDLIDKGFRHDIIDAVLDTDLLLTNLYTVQSKVSILSKWVDTESAKNVIMAISRVIRISKENGTGEIKVSLFEKEQEKDLYNAFRLVTPDYEHHINKNDYNSGLITLQNLVTPINNFFDNVMIMVDNQEIKNNRLLLLNEIKKLTFRVANLDKIVN